VARVRAESGANDGGADADSRRRKLFVTGRTWATTGGTDVAVLRLK
jgi:hypothetical protein